MLCNDLRELVLQITTPKFLSSKFWYQGQIFLVNVEIQCFGSLQRTKVVNWVSKIINHGSESNERAYQEITLKRLWAIKTFWFGNTIVLRIIFSIRRLYFTYTNLFDGIVSIDSNDNFLLLYAVLRVCEQALFLSFELYIH